MNNMKTALTLVTCLTFVFSMSFNKASAQIEPIPGKLPVYGQITAEGKKVKEGTVKIYQGNILWKELETTKKGYFEIGLDLNSHYTFEFETEGMIPKRISMNTQVEKKNAKPIPFECYIDLVGTDKINGQDISNLDFPVAIVKYNAKKRLFEPSLTYTMNMLKEYDRLVMNEE